MGDSKNQGPLYVPQTSRALIIRTPTKSAPQIFGNPHICAHKGTLQYGLRADANEVPGCGPAGGPPDEQRPGQRVKGPDVGSLPEGPGYLVST